MPSTEHIPILRYDAGTASVAEDAVVCEARVTLELDGRELIRTTCSPGQLREWAIGYLVSEGILGEAKDLADLQEVDGRLIVRLVDAAAAASLMPPAVESDLKASQSEIVAAVRRVVERAKTFHATGGTHAMGLVDEPTVVAFAEDISRTCALEKALGLALAAGAPIGRCVAVLSSRVPERMVLKLARCRVPIIAAVSAPTVEAVRAAERLNVCLCGFVRQQRFNVYANGWRIAG